MSTDRRAFIKTTALSGLGLAAVPTVFSGMSDLKAVVSSEGMAIPGYPQLEWQDSELGLIFHFDISIATKNFKGEHGSRDILDPKLYDPVMLNTDQWIETAKNAGAKYAIFTATHFGGFMQWQSDLYPYGLKQAKWRNGKGDIVADFVQSCYKYGIKPGIYFSTHLNAWWKVDDFYVDWGKGKGSSAQKKFNRICEQMTEELCSRYGRLLQIWYDAGVKTPEEGGPDVLPIFEKYQPNGIFYSNTKRSDIRWVGNESGFANDPCWATMPAGLVSHAAPGWQQFLGSGDRKGSVWSPAMVDIPLRGARGIHDWFYHPNREAGIYDVEALTKIYNQSVGRNCNLIIGAVIDPDGLVPEADAQRLAAFGESLKMRFAHPLAVTSGEGSEYSIRLKSPAGFNEYMLQEDIRFGELVEAWKLKGRLTTGNWVDIDEGVNIGHKRIGQCKLKDKFSELSLSITKSSAEPKLRQFAIF